ncbi:MAG TPA: VOC family protein [Vicinamibacterales bacterium]|nr:VOC family protein [Vicinamibacterales bacterium]
MRTSRRAFMAGLGAVAVPLVQPARVWAAQASTPLLPLRTPKIDHLDVIVPNVEASARFYMGVFNTTLHAQPFQGGFRYFVLFGDLPASRQVGYLAIGDSRGRGTYIGHFCTSVFDYRRDSAAIMSALADATDKAGLGKLAGGGGIGGIFSDPDGIEIQFLPAPDTLVTAAVPSDLVPSRKGLVKPLGVDHVLLHVADLEKGVRFYRILYGLEALTDRTTGRVWFRIGDTRLGLQQAEAGQKPHIAHFGIKVAPFDTQKVTAGLIALGARVTPSPYEPDVVRLTDPDGISFEIVAP